MPSKKRKYNARFPPARIKKIMQMDEEVGKVAATVPVIISRALELFIESLIQQATQSTMAKNAKTLSASHLYEKKTIESQERYKFLRELVANVPDHQVEEESGSSNHNNGEESSSVRRRRGGGAGRRSRKSAEGSTTGRKRDYRKRKKETSSSSESDHSEETDDADERTDEESVPAPLAMGITSSITSTSPTTSTTVNPSNGEPSSSAAMASPSRFAAANQLQSQEEEQQQQVPEGSSGVTAATFQAPSTVPAAMAMYQGVAGAAVPHLFSLASPVATTPGVMTPGFPPTTAHTPGIANLQPAAMGFSHSLLPGVRFPTMTASQVAFHGLAGGSGFEGMPWTPRFAGASSAGAGCLGLPPKVSAATSRSQVDDDYDV